MEQESPGRSHRLRDEDFDVHGARNISKLEKLETERTQTTTSKSVTTHGAAQNQNGDASTPSSEILIDDALEQRTISATADNTDDWHSRKTEQCSELVEQRTGTQARSYDAEERRSATAEQRSNAKKQKYSTRSLTRRERNIAAAELAYRMAGLPADVEFSQVSKRSKVVDADSRSKRRGGLRALEDTADMVVEDTMEDAIEALYGKKRRRKIARDAKTSSAGETRSLDRHARTTTTIDGRAHSGYDTTLSENRAFGRTINETTSRDESRKKAVSYLTVEKDGEDIEDDLDLRRSTSADGRLTNRVDYLVPRRAQMAHRLPLAATSKSRQQVTYMSPATSRYQSRTATTQQVSGYSSETELKQVSRRTDQRRHFSGEDSDFSTTVEIRNPGSAQLQIENGGYTSDESGTWNMQSSTSPSQIPTLTKGMVTKILHGERPQSPTTEILYSDVRRADVQSVTSPVQFTASPPPAINVWSSPTVYRDSRLSAVVPVGDATESRSTYRTSAVDDNFLLQRAPAYQQRIDTAQYFTRQSAAYGAGRTGRSTPTSVQTIVENDERPPWSYTAFSNEPIIVADLDDDYTTKTMPMRRSRSLFALESMSPAAGSGIGRSQTPTYYSSRPDIRMTNRQVLNLYLFNKTGSEDRRKDRTAELETVTHTLTFDEKAHRTSTGNKQTQTSLPSARREHVPLKSSKRRTPTPSRVTEETVIVKPSITETRETEMIGDVFADRRRVSFQESEPPYTFPVTRSSLVSDAREELPQEEPEEEILETTVVEEKEQRIEMTIREDLEFSLQRSRGTATGNAVTGPAEKGRVEPWWIPDTFEAFVERKRQKVTQTKDTENKDDHSKRVDVEKSARTSQDSHDASESRNVENSSNYETNSRNQSTQRNQRAIDRNVRIPIFLEGRYQSPMYRMTSPSSNLVRSKMTTHSEPEMNRRNQYYMAKRDKYYGSLFDDSHRKPLITGNRNNENSVSVTPSRTKKRQETPADIPEFRLEVVDDDEASDGSNSTAQDPSGSAERRYVSSYSHYISPPISSSDNMRSTSGNNDVTSVRSVTGIHPSHHAMTPVNDPVFPTSKIITLPNIEPENGKGRTHRPDDEQLPASLDHFDRVLAEIEEELPPPPPPLPPQLPPGSNQAQNTSSQSSLTSQRHSVAKSSTMSADTPQKQNKSTPIPPEKSLKRSGPLPSKSGKLYSSQERPAVTTTSVIEKQKRPTASRSERQSTSSKDNGTSAASSSAAGRQQPGGSDFHRELGDRSYVSLSLTEPAAQPEDQRRRIDVVTRGQQAEPGAFTYGWASHDQKKRKHARQPGSYQLRHSRCSLEDCHMAATAF